MRNGVKLLRITSAVCVSRTCDGRVPALAPRGAHLRIEDAVLRLIALDGWYFPRIGLGGRGWCGLCAVCGAGPIPGCGLCG